MPIYDKLKRSLEYLRISLTDRCNYRCSYCMPKDIFNINENFYDHLCNTGELNTPFHFYIDFDEFIEYIYENHMF